MGDRVVRVGLAEVGVQEQPLGSNRGRRIYHYMSFTWLRPGSWPWCVAFGQRTWSIAGLKCPWRGAGAYAALAWAKAAGWYSRTPVKGAWAVFNIGAGHLAVVVKWTRTHLYTVDGNASDRVKVCKRPHSLVAGYVVHPELDDRVPAKPRAQAKPPLFEIVTSNRGNAKVVARAGRGAITRRAAAGMANWLRLGKVVTVRRVPKKKRRKR